MMLKGAQELAGFISKNYSGKVIEVGVGHVVDVALCLFPLKVLTTDTEERYIHGIKVEKDDIFSPRKEIYEGSSLIYSLRPSYEVQLAIGEIAREIGADIIIRPLEDEIIDLQGFNRHLINLGNSRLYLFKRLH
jgi:uncharacterized UPF0146 family protein